MIRFIQLLYFTKIVEHGSFSAAAKNLYVSQSALSQAMSGLEAELGVELIRRSKSGVRPTYFGHLVYENAKSLIDSFQQFETGTRNLLSERGRLSGQVKIQCTPGTEDYLSSTIIPELNAAYPGIEVIIVSSTDMLKGFQNFVKGGGALGIGACLGNSWDTVCSQAEASGLVCEFFGSENPQILVSVRNPLAQEASLSREQLSQLQLICPTFAPVPRYLPLFSGLASRVPNKESVVRLVADSNFAGVFAPSSIRRELSEYGGQVRLIPLSFHDETIQPVVHYLIHAPESNLLRHEQCTLDLVRRYPYTECSG